MEVRLVDQGGIMANIALMKISSYHKRRGDRVDWHNPLVDGDTDILYISKIFDFVPDYPYAAAREAYTGGTGYDVSSVLPAEIEAVNDLDYSIYNGIDYSMQFYSRGCVRKCPFCVVPQKEGYIKAVEPMRLNPRGTRIEVLDNNFFANPQWKEAIKDLIMTRQTVNFHGIDARLMDQEKAYFLNKVKLYKRLHIAWDNPKEDVIPYIKTMTEYIKAYKIMCYVLIGYWSTPEEDLERVEKLRELGISPFVMPFDKSDPYQRRFARWVNHKAVFNTTSWQNYRG